MTGKTECCGYHSYILGPRTNAEITADEAARKGPGGHALQGVGIHSIVAPSPVVGTDLNRAPMNIPGGPVSEQVEPGANMVGDK